MFHWICSFAGMFDLLFLLLLIQNLDGSIFLIFFGGGDSF
ncbi:putative membrane protein [Synechococcus sp. SYN20]|nr:putative membrane protein [Synechococcus sp. SYN20]